MAAEMKLLTTPQVRELAAKAREHRFDNQLTEDALARLDDNKFHLAADMYRRSGTVLYHKVKLMLGMKNRTGTRQSMLDIADEDWAPLPDAETLRAAIRAEDS